jgi:ribosomal protein S18 acetylase RimI-like enzyme
MKAEFVRRTQAGAQRIENFAIRRPCVRDHDGIREFLTGLSPRARYLRFFSGAPPTSGAMLRILAGEATRTDVLVATGDGAIIGHAMAGDRTGPGGARLTEIGVVVADAYRGQGIGSALVRRLITRAQIRGATALVMEVLAENRQVLTMISDHWPVASEERSGAYITISARLQPGVPSWPDSRPGAEQWPDHVSWLPGFGKEAVAAGIAGRTAR